MTAPTCPTHQKVMRPGQGGFFCPSKMPDGSWCTYKVKPEPAAEPATNHGTAPASGDALAVASLSFAAALFRGAGTEMGDDAIALAIKTYQAMSAIK